MSPPITQILIVDDEDDTRANLVDILELFEYRPVTAETGAAALAHPNLNLVDVILLDRKLPDTLADDLLPKLVEAAPQASVIIATAYGDLDSTIGALRAGASDYLLKPINPDALHLAIERILERRRLEETVLRSERLAAIGKAMTALAHQSRNALQRSQASLDLLADELSENEFASKLLGRIRSAQDDLHRLYEDVREYARPIQVVTKPTSLVKLLEQAWQELSVKREGRDVSLKTKTESDEVACAVEPFLIRQVFHNILDNALAACADPVEIEARFARTTHRNRAAVSVSIQDNGPGLPEDAHQRAFDEFFTTRSRGSGLGLAIAKRFIESHHGEISLESTAAGAIVSFVLPIDGAMTRESLQ
jgi:signal transduction histidine kinase